MNICGRPFTLKIEAAKLIEFAQALGDVDSVHVDRDAARKAGFRDLVAPIGSIVWTLGQDREALFEAFGLRADRGLAGSEGWEFLAPIYAEDLLTGQSTLVDVEKKTGRSGEMSFHRFQTIYANQFGERVLIENSMVMQWAHSPLAGSEV
jgi:acyl dehydratase